MNFRFKRVTLGTQQSAKRSAADVPSNLTTARPGMLLVLIDQSTSMGRCWGNTEQLRKDLAAAYVNKMIKKVLNDSAKDGTHARRIWVAVFGYSNQRHDPTYERAFRLLADGWPEAFADRADGWIQPEADGDTLMALAFQGARQYIQQFFASDPARCERFRDSAPTVILNVTDGEANEFRAGQGRSLEQEVKRVWDITLPNGLAPLVFHAHISSGEGRCVVFPPDDSELDAFGKELFKLASEIPHSWVDDAGEMISTPVARGAVGLVINAGPDELLKFLTLSSRSSR